MKKIIISRTDSIGDVILTLPMAGVLKKHFPDCTIYFLGRNYTQPIIESCTHIDGFIEWGPEAGSQKLNSLNADVIIHAFPVMEICKAAKEAAIPVRIATSHRWYTWMYCNKLLHFSRKNSELHEAQLNLRMLAPLGIKDFFSLEELPEYFGLTKLREFSNLQIFKSPVHHLTSSPPRFNLILHPKSKGSAREWGLDNFSRLIALLPEDKFSIYITGTKEEGLLMQDFLRRHEKRVTDLSGKLTLTELISFIDSCDGLVAASTGPLHIAAALGKTAIGLYAPMKPIHPGRWAPLGKDAHSLVLDKSCNDCKKSMDCECIRSIDPGEVAEMLVSSKGKKLYNLEIPMRFAFGINSTIKFFCTAF